jgi:very-short-patch-repair endonuclease
MPAKNIEQLLKKYENEVHRVVPFERDDKLLLLDFTERNKELSAEILENTNRFIKYINLKLEAAGAQYGIGGYGEHRTIYSRSRVFDAAHPDLPEGKVIYAQPSLQQESDFEAINSLEEPEGQYGYQWADPFYYKRLKQFAVEHRNNPTNAEDILWNAIKSKQLGNYKFRRQHIIDKYITDIVCLDKRLIIEIDGLVHQLPENIESDKERTKVLEEKGFEVIRFSNDEVINERGKVLQLILQKLNDSRSIKESSSLSSPFGGQGAEPRRLHLGIDIWGRPYTKVMAPLDGIVHSFAFNNAFGDYGATIILTHNLDGRTFHTLYGHLSLNSIKNIQEGDRIKKGDVFTEFGIPFENGQWPPHLHFQLIIDIEGRKGDYPGVCKFSEREKYLSNCPNPDLILQMMQYAKK